MNVTALYDEVLRLAYVDVAEAGRAAESLRALAFHLGDDYSRAQAHRADGHVHYVSGRHQEAVDCYSAAVEVLSSGPNEMEIGRTLLSGLQALAYLGRYEEALVWAARARAIFEQAKDRLRLARLCTNEGNILYRQDRYVEAIVKYSEAHELFIGLGQARDMAAVLSNLAVARIALGDYEGALDYYRQSRDHCLKHNLPILAAAADYNIAYLYFQRGEYLDATRLYAATRERCAKAGDKYHLALCDLDESELYLELNLAAEAQRLALRAERSFAALGMNYERAKALVNSAVAAGQRGDSKRAFAQFRAARRLFAAERNTLGPALIDLYSASLRFQQHRYGQAKRLLDRAARALRGDSLPSKLLAARILSARIQLKLGEGSKALESAELAVASIGPAVNPVLRFHARLALAEALESMGELREALAHYLAAKDEIEELRNGLWSEDLKISILDDKEAAFEGLVCLQLQLSGAPEPIFDWIEQAKSRTLIDLLVRGAPSPRLPLEDVRRDLHWHYRQREITALLSRAGLGEQNSTRLAALEVRIRELESQLTRIAKPADLESANPHKIEVFREHLSTDATLISYFTARGQLFALLADRRQTRVVQLASVEAVAHHFHLLQFQMAKFRLGAAYLDHFGPQLLAATHAHLRALHGFLIEPLEGYLQSSHLLIAPHGFLHNLPFATLIARDGTSVIDRYSVSHTPSASVYSICASRAARFEERSLVLGVSDPRLPHIEAEARSAAAALPRAELLLGEAATEAALRSCGQKARYIHIATHGYFRRDNPLFSAIRLGPSFLSLMDLYSIPLEAELITLSGCSTGLSHVAAGDELLGLTRGLLQAGAHSMLVSLWDIHDDSTSRFMQSFYSNLGGTANKAAALRKTQLELKQQTMHPYYWGAFTLVGKYQA